MALLLHFRAHSGHHVRRYFALPALHRGHDRGQEGRLCLDVFFSRRALEEGHRGLQILLAHLFHINLGGDIDHFVGLFVELGLERGKDRIEIVEKFRPRLGQRRADLIHELRNDDAKGARHSRCDHEGAGGGQMRRTGRGRSLSGLARRRVGRGLLGPASARGN